MDLPKRKRIRLEEYDYSTPGAYFITFCVKNRDPILWNHVGAAVRSQNNNHISPIGQIVDIAIQQIPLHYPSITVDKYCIMPDHVHLILSIQTDEHGRQVAAPTISTVVGHMKRWVSMQIGVSIWQKSFIDRVIRNEDGYRKVWEYIDNNPIKLDFAYDNIDFTEM